MKEIGKECSYSRAFFINLTKYFSKLDNHYQSQQQQKEIGEEPETVASAGKVHKVTAEQMLQVLGSLRSGPMAMNEMLMLDEERKK